MFNRLMYANSDIPQDVADALAGLLVFFGIIAIFVGIVYLVFYLLRSVGLYRLAKRRQLSAPGIAWLPVLYRYTAGAIADDISGKNQGKKTSFRFILLAGSLVMFVLNIINWVLVVRMVQVMIPILWYIIDNPYALDPDNPYAVFETFPEYTQATTYTNLFNSISSLVSLAVFIVLVIVLYKIYKEYRPGSATAWTVLNIIFPFLQSVFPFALRNSVPMQQAGPRYTPGGYQPPYNPYQQPGQMPPQQGFQTPPQGYQAPPQQGYYQNPNSPPNGNNPPQQ